MNRFILIAVTVLLYQAYCITCFRSPDEFQPTGEVIGEGSFGVVQKVKDRYNDHRTYVQKDMDPYDSTTTMELDVAERLKRNKSCPYLVKAVAYDTVTRFDHYGKHLPTRMVMEFLNGEDLFKLVHKNGRLSENLARLYAMQIALGMECLHEQDILYKDAKPENTMLKLNSKGKQSGRLKLIDFGISAIVKNGIDVEGRFAGTIRYMAPEVLAGKTMHFAVDWWALGIIIYEMVVGETPFNAGNKNQIIRNINNYAAEKRKLHFPRDPNISTNGKDLIRSLLDPNRDHRLGVRNGGRKSYVDDVLNHPWFDIRINKISMLKLVEGHTYDFSEFVALEFRAMKAEDQGYTVADIRDLNQMENDRNRIDAKEMKLLQNFALGLGWQLKEEDQKIQAANEFRNQAVQKEWSAYQKAQYAEEQLRMANEERARAQREREVAERSAKEAADRKAKLQQHLGKVNQQIGDNSKPRPGESKPIPGVEYVSASTVRHPPRRQGPPGHKPTCGDCARNEPHRRGHGGHRRSPEVGGRG